EVEVDLPSSTTLPQEQEALIFRTIQEGLRNAAKHASARHVNIRVRVEDHVATAVVSDDGRGFDPDRSGNGDSEAHMGLELLSDLAADAGGRLSVASAPGEGTKLTLEV